MGRWIVACLIALPSVALAEDSRRATLDCQPTPTRLDYQCRIGLATADGRPLTGAKMAVGADMPSMPMMHNVRPVTAQPTETPGVYAVLLKLEMFGIWAVNIDLSAPHRERIVIKRDFSRDDQGGASAHKH